MKASFAEPCTVVIEFEIATPAAFDGANIGVRFAKLAVVVPIAKNADPGVLLFALKGLAMQAACEKIDEHRDRIVADIEAAKRRAYGVRT